MKPPPGRITELLHAGAEAELWQLAYGELKGLARAVLRGRRRAAGPQTTTLVHEAYLRLAGAETGDLENRRHFFAIAARAMRFVLVDDARRRLSAKRGAGEDGIPLDCEGSEPAAELFHHGAEEVLAVHEALHRLAEVNERHVKLVELRFFSGFSVDETAEVLGISRPTAVRDWRAVKVWLHSVLAEAPSMGAPPAEV